MNNNELQLQEEEVMDGIQWDDGSVSFAKFVVCSSLYIIWLDDEMLCHE